MTAPIDAIRRSSGASVRPDSLDAPSSDTPRQDHSITHLLQEIERLLQQALQRLSQQSPNDGGDRNVSGPAPDGNCCVSPQSHAAPRTPSGAAPTNAAPQPVTGPQSAAAVPAVPAAPVAPAAPAAPPPPVVLQPPPAPTGGDLSPQQVASTFKDDIAAASKATGVPPGILAGQIWQESKGLPKTPGGGLMQIGPAEFSKYGGGDISNAHDNIMAAAKYMEHLTGQFGGNVDVALRAYNSGPNGVDVNDLNATPAGTGDPTYIDKVKKAAKESGLATD